MPAQLQRRLAVFLMVIGVIALALLLHWLLVGRHHVSTDNAYVQAEITRISSQLNARVAEVLVDDNQRVAKGDLLVRLEADDFRLDLQRAEAALATREAELAQAQSRLQQQDSLIDASQADVIASSANLDRTRTDLSRAETLRKPGYVSEERVTTLLDNRSKTYFDYLRESIVPSNPQVAERLAMYTEKLGSESAALGKINEIAHQQAQIMAFNDAFMAIALGVSISLVAILLTKKLPANGSAEPVH